MSFTASPNSSPLSHPSGTAVGLPAHSSRRIALALALVCLAALGLYVYPTIRAELQDDDFQLLVRGWTWPRTQASLWEPHNEHVMPLGRLSTWAICQLAGRPSLLPFVTAPQGPLALLAGMVLLFCFIRNELGHSFYGLAAAAFFGTSTVYDQAVTWFAASFSVLALDTLLLGLLAAQRWRRTGRWPWLAGCAAACALAPAWFATGVLAGPLCTLYLLPMERKGRLRERLLPFAFFLVPLLGSVAFLAVSLPLTWQALQHLKHYEGKTPVQAFNPLLGLWYTGRSLVDNLALGVFGITGVCCPWWVVPLLFTALAVGAVWWLRRAPCRRLLVLGLGFILLNYVLVYSARAEVENYAGTGWDDPGMAGPVWGRYHLGPQLGLTLFLAGGLPRWRDRLGLDPSGALTKRQVRWLLVAALVLFAINLPRGLLVNLWRDPELVRAVLGTYDAPRDPAAQRRALCDIEAMDRRCRAHRIRAATAGEALPRLDIPGSGDRENGWDFLHGSPDPLPWTAEEAHRLLTDEE